MKTPKWYWKKDGNIRQKSQILTLENYNLDNVNHLIHLKLNLNKDRNEQNDIHYILRMAFMIQRLASYLQNERNIS